MDDIDTSATPLDLLLNAITEEGEADQFTYHGDLGGLLDESGYVRADPSGSTIS